MPSRWQQISRQHVLEAVERYKKNPDLYNLSRHTFLVVNGKQYPAKAIRGIAYEVCFGESISSDAFTGGRETKLFFERLHLEVVSATSVGTRTGGTKSTGKAALDKISQKNALQRLLQKRFGVVVAEKGFDWLCTPCSTGSDELYHRIYEALRNYRGYERFFQPGRRLTVDFYVESLNLVIEYYDDQHFSEARRIAIECYPPDLNVGFSAADWVESCVRINASDNSPAYRDESRAFYDAVRDIEMARQGMGFLRIRHGAFDWNGADSEAMLIKLLEPFLAIRESLQVVSRKTANQDWRQWRCYEVDVQRIRLNYLKWLTHFAPPRTEVFPECSSGEDWRIFESWNGATFTAFPCGLGSVYVGGRHGQAKLPSGCFSHCPDLDAETRHLKGSLATHTRILKQKAVLALDNNDLDAVWSDLLEYWWNKLGLHEHAYDVAYGFCQGDHPVDYRSVRHCLISAMRNGLTAADVDIARFGKDELRHFICYQTKWNRYACCSFECGPIALGKASYVPYDEVARRLREFFVGRSTAGATEIQRRLLARESLSDRYEFLAMYYEEPWSQTKTYRGLIEHRESLNEMIRDVQNALNQIITNEGLGLKPFEYVPV